MRNIDNVTYYSCLNKHFEGFIEFKIYVEISLNDVNNGGVTMEITEMRSSRNGKFFMAGSSDGEIIVINSETAERFGAYQTKFESGGRRMCVSDDGEYFAAGSYSRDVSVYETKTGKAVYRDDTFFHTQNLRFSLDRKQLFVFYSDIMYIMTLGEKMLDIKHNISDYYPDDEMSLTLSGDEMQIKFPGKILKLEKSVMDMFPKNGRVYCALFGGGIKCFSKTKKELWSAESNPNEHYQRIAYCDKLGYVMGLGFKFNEPRTEPFHFVDVRNAETGELIYTVGLNGANYFAFTYNGIAASNGDFYELHEKDFTLHEKRFDVEA